MTQQTKAATEACTITQVTILAHEDQRPISSFILTPTEKQTDVVVVVAPATAVPCKFYIPYLQYLATHGIFSITFDWRGTHTSLIKNQKEDFATLDDWGRKDLAGVIDYVSENYPDKRIVHFGHSVGGHVMPWPYNRDKISHAITLGAQNAFYPLTPFRARHQIFWNVAVPAASSIFGHFPGSKLKIVGDLPIGVMKEWRSWAYNPHYIAGITPERQESYKKFNKPILAISVSDDEYATRLGVQLFHKELGSNVQFWHIENGDIPGKFPIRHVGFFTPYFKKYLWVHTVPFILSGVLPDATTLVPNAAPTTDLYSRL